MGITMTLGFQGATVVKNPPVNAGDTGSIRETQVQSLGREDPLEKKMTTHSSILPGKSYGQRSLTGNSPWGHKELVTTQ